MIMEGSGAGSGPRSVLKNPAAQQHPDPSPDPDRLVEGMDTRIRIHTKMSWIRNTAVRKAQKDMDPDPELCIGHSTT
jgi:hypothetical protein